jgi:hypothetical protein
MRNSLKHESAFFFFFWKGKEKAILNLNSKHSVLLLYPKRLWKHWERERERELLYSFTPSFLRMRKCLLLNTRLWKTDCERLLPCKQVIPPQQKPKELKEDLINKHSKALKNTSKTSILIFFSTEVKSSKSKQLPLSSSPWQRSKAWRVPHKWSVFFSSQHKSKLKKYLMSTYSSSSLLDRFQNLKNPVLLEAS